MKKTIIALLMILFLYSCNKKDKIKVFLIPKGYEGPLIIIEDQKLADTVPYNNDTLFFDFRKSKILRLKYASIEGTNPLSNLQYYYIDNLNNKTLIPFLINGETTNIDSNQVYVYIQNTQIGGGCPKLGFGGSQCDLISTPKNITSNLDQQQRMLDSIISCPVDTVN